MVAQVESVGVQLLSSIIRTNNRRILNLIHNEWISDHYNEVQLYEFINQHVRAYNSLPAMSTVREAGYPIPQVPETPEYYLEQISQRYDWDFQTDIYERQQVAMSSHNLDEYKRLSRLSASSNRLGTSARVSLVDASNNVMTGIQNNRFNTGGGLMTGYSSIDNDLKGLRGDDLLVFVGRMKRGKTMFLINILINMWLDNNRILVVSMEMTPEAIAARIIAIMNGVNPSLLREHELDAYTFAAFREEVRGFGEQSPFEFVHGNFNKNMDDIRREADVFDPDIIAIDGLYLMNPVDKKSNQANHERISDVMVDLKTLCFDHQTPSISTVQFNRGAAAHTDRRTNRMGNDDLDVQYVGGSEAISQIASGLYGVGNIGNVTNRMRIKSLALRDGQGCDFVTRFEFSPPNFSEIGPYIAEDYSGGMDTIDEESRVLNSQA